ncbi:Na(+)/H(+) exchange regulatory cofactor NHE-RF1 [Bagarius yarrelli]|uniref:Na(+)/H(+) exchange regulatory cofactor NHE-RF1 n=1 Tax=Bagarius yarrelli TaxID=175774 RepID=A0A556TJD7_BAGYA|nr:Na(+)/H(+) exchange regulatory cofactor NHE-RF1 [Bagarius yarrelli]
MSNDLRPRMCVLEKGSDGYGFHLHGEKNKAGQFIRLVEPQSPAELSGLRAGDKLAFVNGESVVGESHQQVVSRIRAVSGKLELIVLDPETAEYLKKHNLNCRKEYVSEGLPTFGDQPDTTAQERNGTATAVVSSPVPEPDPVPDPVTASSHVPDPVPAFTPVSDPVPAPVPVESKNELRPRLCIMKKGATGYGFNLHSDKSKTGQYIRAVDEDSPAEKSGLRPQDKVVQVNGMAVHGLQHSEVVAAIKAGGDELHLLVMDPDTEAFFNSCQVLPTEEHLTGKQQLTVRLQSYRSDRAGILSANLYSCLFVGPLPEPATNNDADEKVKEEAVQEAKPASASPTPSSASSTTSIPAETASSPPTQEKREKAVENVASSLDLNISLQQAKERAHQKRSNKKAPPMDWSKRSEVFSNL